MRGCCVPVLKNFGLCGDIFLAACDWQDEPTQLVWLKVVVVLLRLIGSDGVTLQFGPAGGQMSHKVMQ